jgi:hypothetical protein
LQLKKSLKNKTMNRTFFITVNVSIIVIVWTMMSLSMNAQNTSTYNIWRGGAVIGYLNGAEVDSSKIENGKLLSYLSNVSSVTTDSREINVAEGKPVTVSGTDGGMGWPKEYAVDGDRNTRWNSAADTTGNHWIEVDLGAAYTITRFDAYTLEGYPTERIHFQIPQEDGSEDGSWETVYAIDDNTAANVGASFSDGPVVASKIRLWTDGASEKFRLFELEVYARLSVSEINKNGIVGSVPSAGADGITNDDGNVLSTLANVDSLVFIPVPLINFALNKPVVSSDTLTSGGVTYLPGYAVDGKYKEDDGSRWISTGSGEHWLEIDLQGEYTVTGFKTYSGRNSTYNGGDAITRLKLQIFQEGDWFDVHDSGTGNGDATYGATLATPVVTSKVRLYAYSQARLYEIEILGF